jgi:hypothetical protein
MFPQVDGPFVMKSNTQEIIINFELTNIWFKGEKTFQNQVNMYAFSPKKIKLC